MGTNAICSNMSQSNYVDKNLVSIDPGINTCQSDYSAKSFMQVGPDVSKEFVKKVEGDLSHLPEEIKRKIVYSGGGIFIGKSLDEAFPALAKEHPRGYSKIHTWSGVAGLYNEDAKQVRIFEKAEKTTPREQTLHHETGHMVDYIYGNVSNSPEFIKAYEKDIEAQTFLNTLFVNLSYFKQKGKAGREETFAQIFGELHGGTGHDIRKHFPNVTELMREKYK